MGLSLEFHVRCVSPLPLGGFSVNFGQMFTCGTMCRTHNSAMGTQGQGHSSRSRVWALNFMSTWYLLYPWSDFLLILVKCLLSEMMCRTHSSTMQTHKVTVQGHGFEPWILCPLCISFTPGRIFSKLWSNVHLSGTICRIHNSALWTWGQGHSWRSWVNLEFGVGSISPLPLEGFSLNIGQMFASVRWCADYNSAMLNQGQGHNWRSPVWALNFEAAPLPFRLPC